jgi:hypothetical protein
MTRLAADSKMEGQRRRAAVVAANAPDHRLEAPKDVAQLLAESINREVGLDQL